MESFDFAIIGAGPGGYVSAIRAAQLGLKTALIEKDDRLGGCCLNVGCIPSKALLESSEWYTHALHSFSDHGIGVSDLKIDLKQMMKRKTEIVHTLTDGIAILMKKNKVKVFQGAGSLAGEGKIKVKNGEDVTEIRAESIALAMGSIPVELPFMKFDGKQIVSSTEALSFNTVPGKLIVVGAGAIGLELGSVWNRLGSEVTVIEMLPQVAAFADKQMAVMLQRSLTKQGMKFHLNSKVTGAVTKRNNVELTFSDATGKEQSLKANKALVAVGRKPNPYTAGLKNAGVKIEKNGVIPVDDRWQTNVKGIYAIGDLIEGPMLAHKAEEEGMAVAEIVAGKPGHVNYEAIPNIIYTSPELAVVGLSEEALKEKGVKYKTGKFFFRGNGRALTLGEADGLVKILADAETDRLLGVHILGVRASDMIAEIALAFEFEASAEDLARTVHAHPTLSEIIKEAALAVDKRPIHG